MPAAAGLHLCARLAPDAHLDLTEVVARARERGVGVDELAGYCGEEPAQHGLLIGYGAIRSADLGEALRRLARSFAG